MPAREMAKKRKAPSRRSDDTPAGRMLAAREAGDYREARRLARQILADPEADEASKLEAREVDRGLKIAPLALAFVVGGLLLWGIIFGLGVLARH